MVGVTFAEKWHTYRDWGLELLSIYIPMPEPKLQIIEKSGGDGSIDLTDLNGRPSYSDRDGIELTFYFINEKNSAWLLSQSQFAKCIHGKQVKLVLDDEPDHYYMARLKVDGKKTNYMMGQITLSGTAEPFKCDLQSSAEEWLWDSFNFESGVIRSLSDIVITTTNKTIKILGGGIDSPPVFIVTSSSNLTLTYKSRSYVLKVGRNRFPAVRVGEEDVTLSFTGTGRLSIEYRGRYL